MGYASLTHGYNLADARLASSPDAIILRFVLCMDAFALVIRVLSGRRKMGRRLPVGYASLTHGYNLADARLASSTDAPCRTIANDLYGWLGIC